MFRLVLRNSIGAHMPYVTQEIAEYKKLDGANGRFWVVKPEVRYHTMVEIYLF